MYVFQILLIFRNDVKIHFWIPLSCPCFHLTKQEYGILKLHQREPSKWEEVSFSEKKGIVPSLNLSETLSSFSEQSIRQIQ